MTSCSSLKRSRLVKPMWLPRTKQGKGSSSQIFWDTVFLRLVTKQPHVQRFGIYTFELSDMLDFLLLKISKAALFVFLWTRGKTIYVFTELGSLLNENYFLLDFGTYYGRKGHSNNINIYQNPLNSLLLWFRFRDFEGNIS